MNSFGSKIKQIRKSAKMTQKDFAESICISQSHLSKVEHNEERLSKSVKKILSIIYEIDEEYLQG